MTRGVVLLFVAVVAAGLTLGNAAGVELRPRVAVASLHCPAPEHAMWAPSIGRAVCGDLRAAGVKPR